MRMFVTGASGFVGAAAARPLADAGHEGTALSRAPGSDAAIADLGHAPGLTVAAGPAALAAQG
jgi:nucleoside-diphosphate-sugar epimerase